MDKEFLASEFQRVLKCEGIQFQLCKNPNRNVPSWSGRTV